MSTQEKFIKITILNEENHVFEEYIIPLSSVLSIRSQYYEKKDPERWRDIHIFLKNGMEIKGICKNKFSEINFPTPIDMIEYLISNNNSKNLTYLELEN